MNTRHWDNIACIYDKVVFDSFKNDKNNVILKYINKYFSDKSNVCDFGCGIGRFLPLLCDKFKKVYAIDLSNKCLEIAKKNNKHLKEKITYINANLIKDNLNIKNIECAICINLLIMPSYKNRLSILNNIHSCISHNGYLLLIIPSLESALYANFMLFEWNISNGMKQIEAIKDGMKKKHKNRGSISDGLLIRGNSITKHYLKEEILLLLRKTNFKIIKIEKVEYNWVTEFVIHPNWMNDPFPWDWLVLCRKI